ncbi:MAG: hypothetical protein KQ78_01867 [Candidatus Izimaplasma bacterium HR2]|nr:MAG: hypothetical protein KQ78_01867 [Candidatus Izimaplasma bacterium HR2]
MAIYEENLRLIADYQLNIVRREGNIDEIRNYAPIDKCLSFERNLSNSPCGAGKNFVTITANGEIYPCHHFYFNDPNKETKIGDLDNGLDEAARRIYIDYDGTDLTCEKNCPNNSCYRCIAQNWTDKGSIFSQIKGINCLFSGVEKKIQDYTLKELRKMGIFNKSNQKSNNPNCLCDLRSGENQSNQSNNSDCYCDLRTGNSQTEGVGCGNNVTPKNNQSKESDCYCDLRTGNTQTIFPEGEKQMSCELNDEKKSKKEIDIILINQLAEAVIKIIDEIEEIKKKIE